jgi:hypothetical protein
MIASRGVGQTVDRDGVCGGFPRDQQGVPS